MNDMDWHDSIIKHMHIDRQNPGHGDTIEFVIERYGGKQVTLRFFEVFWANLNLNMGMIVPESILFFAQLEKNNDDLLNFYSKWKGAYDHFDLNCYVIELNSTGSTIKIIAEGFIVE
jgi:hypothetical protein